jgi:hypothetical protein
LGTRIVSVDCFLAILMQSIPRKIQRAAQTVRYSAKATSGYELGYYVCNMWKAALLIIAGLLALFIVCNFVLVWMGAF